MDHVKLLCEGRESWNKVRQQKAFAPDLTHIEIRNAQLAEIDLSQANFDGSRLENVDLSHANLKNARLNGMNVMRASFQGADLPGTELKGSDFTRVNFADTVIEGAVTFEWKVRHSAFNRSKLRSLTLKIAHFYNCDFRKASVQDLTIQHVVFKRSQMEGTIQAALIDSGCLIELPNLSNTHEWLDWDHFQVIDNPDTFGLVLHQGKTYWISEGRWDFFISHVSQDKETVVRPLAEALRERGQRVWYDALVVKLNDDLGTTIEFGTRASLFGVLVISPQFFGRRWTEREVAALKSKRIFLVLHGVEADALRQIRPELADRLSVSSTIGPDEMADRLVEAIRRPPQELLIHS